ncbi:hypothetical protein AGMMS50276_26890 [Synergistales bacterium]|nr:hypothetical protein AGMMS50276_26890 [Synergistales bacterium]
MPDDVIMNKVAIIERSVERAREEFYKDESSFDKDYTRQDAAILNIQRACEAAIDMGHRVIHKRRLGLPQSASDVFALLFAEGLIDDLTAKSLTGMVGFRNIAVHDYQKIQLPIVKAIITKHLDDLTVFASAMLMLE